MSKIFVLNLGSTSFKFKLYNMGCEETLLATGGIENIGGVGAFKISADGNKISGECECVDHITALEFCMEKLKGIGVDVKIDELDAVGYKAVHGGRISGSHYVDGELISEMEKMCSLAPAHNPVYLAMMKSVTEKYPDLTQIACFETAFHATIPEERVIYGVPYEWIEEMGIRRYGFHGSSHSYIAWKMQQIAPDARRVISIHLGGSCSICAIKDGKSIATSMGATPQSGLFHNNRVGDIDVYCLPPLCEKYGSMEKALKALSKESGLLGISGVSNDMRDVEKAASKGNKRAELAINAFDDNIVGYIGMFTAYLGGLDAICFTGGIGTNDKDLRRRVTEKLEFVNAKIDNEKNEACNEGEIGALDSKVRVFALETNEEIMIARHCVNILNK